MFSEKHLPPGRKERAAAAVRRLGYDFRIISYRWVGPGQPLTLELKLRNQGVAPFYYDWPLECVWWMSPGQVVPAGQVLGAFSKLCPGDADRILRVECCPAPSPTAKLLLRGVNPLRTGRPLRFANAAQDRDEPGYLTIGEPMYR